MLLTDSGAGTLVYQMNCRRKLKFLLLRNQNADALARAKPSDDPELLRWFSEVYLFDQEEQCAEGLKPTVWLYHFFSLPAAHVVCTDTEPRR